MLDTNPTAPGNVKPPSQLGVSHSIKKSIEVNINERAANATSIKLLGPDLNCHVTAKMTYFCNSKTP